MLPGAPLTLGGRVMGELRWLILRFPIIRDRPEPVESAPRRLATMAYGHSRLNPREAPVYAAIEG